MNTGHDATKHSQNISGVHISLSLIVNQSVEKKKKIEKCITNIFSESLSIFLPMIWGNVWLVFIQKKTIDWLVSQCCNVMQHCTYTNQVAGLFGFHSDFRVKQMKTALSQAKGLLDGHSCCYVGFVVCFLFCSGWVGIGVHDIRFTWIPTISQEQTVFSSIRADCLISGQCESY